MRCEHCGAEQSTGKFCDRCGRMLTRVRVETPVAEPTAGRKVRPQILKCSCGHQQSEGHFCDSCGLELNFFRVEEAQEAIGGRCRQCGTWSSASPICPNCGIPIPDFKAEEG
jgi:hypothetical protein